MLVFAIFVGSTLALNRADYPAPLQIPAANPRWTSAIEAKLGNAAPVIDRCTGQNQWAFTFDDGPAAATTIVLDALAARGQKATFFVLGTQMLDNEETLKRIVRDGHQIGIHTWSHPSLPTLSVGQIVAELGWTARIIKEVTGFTPTIMRPPYGDVDDKVLKVAAAMGLSVVKWNRDTNDYNFNNWKPGDAGSPDSISQQFTAWATEPKQGTISLQHDIGAEPAKQAARALDTILRSGYQVTTISSCIGKPAYSDDLLTLIGGGSPGSPPPPPPVTTTSQGITVASTTTISSPSPITTGGSGSIKKSTDKGSISAGFILIPDAGVWTVLLIAVAFF